MKSEGLDLGSGQTWGQSCSTPSVTLHTSLKTTVLERGDGVWRQERRTGGSDRGRFSRRDERGPETRGRRGWTKERDGQVRSWRTRYSVRPWETGLEVGPRPGSSTVDL